MKTQADQPGPPELHNDANGLPSDESAEAEEIRQVAALTWLAESDPIDAAPAGSLDAVRDTLGLSGTKRRGGRWAWPLVAAAGWAAAACIALFANFGDSSQVEERTIALAPAPEQPSPPAPETAQPFINSRDVVPITDTVALREEIDRLRASLNHRDAKRPGIHRPVIVELGVPGAEPVATSRERILDLIVNALENELDQRTGRHPGEVVIERGWADWAAGDLAGEIVFRHRAFPVEAVIDAGLLAGPGDQYLDLSNDWLWAPDLGTGDYVGRAAPEGLDRQLFATRGEIPNAPPLELPPGIGETVHPPAHEEMPLVASTSPTGYFVSAGSDRSIVALNDLPPIPIGHSLELVTADSNGRQTTFTVPNDAVSDGGVTSWDFSGTIPASVGVGLNAFTVQTHDISSGEISVILEGGAAE